MLRLLFVLISMFSLSALVGAVAVSSCILFATSLYALIFILNLYILYVFVFGGLSQQFYVLLNCKNHFVFYKPVCNFESILAMNILYFN